MYRRSVSAQLNSVFVSATNIVRSLYLNSNVCLLPSYWLYSPVCVDHLNLVGTPKTGFLTTQLISRLIFSESLLGANAFFVVCYDASLHMLHTDAITVIGTTVKMLIFRRKREIFSYLHVFAQNIDS